MDNEADALNAIRRPQDDDIVTVFARPVQARFVCWREEERDPTRLKFLGVSSDIEQEDELRDFLRAFIDDPGG